MGTERADRIYRAPWRIEAWTGVAPLLRFLFRAGPALATVAVVLSVVQGVLLPTLTLATGHLVSTLRVGEPTGMPVALIVGVFVLQRLLEPLAAAVGAALSRRADESLADRVMAAMALPAGIGHIEDPEVLDLVAQAQGSLAEVTPGMAALRLPLLWRDRLQAVLSLLIVARWQPVAALAILLTAVPARVVTGRHWHDVTLVMQGRTDRLRRAQYLRTLALTHDVAKETRVFGFGGWLVDQYREGWLRVMREIWSTRSEAWLSAVVCAAAASAAELLALAWVGREAAAGQIGVGPAAAIAAAALAGGALGAYREGHWVAQEGAACIGRVEALEDAARRAEPGGTRTEGVAAMPAREIRFEGVAFAYPGRAEPVYRALDLRIEAGRSLAVVGANGAGKTTLVKLLTRMHEPDGGRITVDGVDLADLDVAAWRRRIAAVFQDHVRFELDARENVGFGALGVLDRPDVEAVLDAVAERAGATALVDRLPNRWDTPLTREHAGGTELSGGEWQRLALARAMLAVEAGAGVLVLDEPTAAMDVRGEAEIYDRFLQLTRGLTTIVISHRFSTVRRADRIVVVEHGEVVEDGTHEELLAREGRYATMYRLQASRFAEPAAGA